ncbi:MAG: hypothetical protein V3W37_00940 [Candidatus Binatia bacterium]
MEVGQAATYVALSGETRDCLVARIENGKANIVLVNAGGAEDHFGRLRSELDGVQIGERLGCVCDLDKWDPDAKKSKKKKKANKKKAS